MSKIYNLLYCIDNTKGEKNCIIDFSTFVKEEKTILGFLDNFEFVPSKRVLNNVLDFARSTVEV